MFDTIRADLERYVCCDERASQSSVLKLLVIVFAYGFQACTIYRYGRFIDKKIQHGLLRPLYLPANLIYATGKFFTEKMYGITINRRAEIGPGFYIGHFGGISIGRCRIGRNCNIHQQVKIGDDCVVGDNTWLGGHAVVENGVSIADHATVVVGARVTSPVCSACMASGNPARIISKSYDNSGLLGLKKV